MTRAEQGQDIAFLHLNFYFHMFRIKFYTICYYISFLVVMPLSWFIGTTGHLNQGFPTAGDLVFLGIVTSDWRPYWFLLFGVGGDTDIYWVEAKFDAKILQCMGQPPTI